MTNFFVYLIASKVKNKTISYVGYTNNLNNRVKLHNNNKGAKSTKGYKWVLIYKKAFKSKSAAMSFEYKLKRNRKERKIILKKYNK